ncbi:hypothetical protein [Falsibacillus pallidus]|uniref:hypothetical protein n=1 Tax=Falsibacillus pallidus TaxID=493781 RepID=UPI003D9715B2
MIWLIVGAPVLLMISISIYFSKKSGAVPPDVNQGNKNIESDTIRNQFLNGGG